MNIPDNPIFVTRDPNLVADTLADRLEALGCSAGYIVQARFYLLACAVQVSSSYEANAILTGRTAR